MIKVNGIEFNFDNKLLELNYNINGTADKQYTWNELKTILSRIPSNYNVLYDTGCVWDTQEKVKYIFDTLNSTPVFKYDFKNDGNTDEHIFSVIDYSDFGVKISTMEYINQLEKAFVKSHDNSLIVEYFNLVLIRP
jgi:hypothetical protein